MLNGLDLFSGIGGLTKALETWVRPVAYCEVDSYCQGVLISRMADGSLSKAPIWDDVRSLDKPCLDYILSHQEEVRSMAGKLKKLTERQVKEAIKGYQQGMSLQDLAHIYFVTRQAMWDLLRRRISLRPQLRYGKENHFYRGGSRADGKANDILERAMRYGKIHNPGKCSVCGTTGEFKDGRTEIQAHHPDYNKPLEILWLCQKCHFQWHKEHVPIGRKGGTKRNSSVDIIYGGFP